MDHVLITPTDYWLKVYQHIGLDYPHVTESDERKFERELERDRERERDCRRGLPLEGDGAVFRFGVTHPLASSAIRSVMCVVGDWAMIWTIGVPAACYNLGGWLLALAGCAACVALFWLLIRVNSTLECAEREATTEAEYVAIRAALTYGKTARLFASSYPRGVLVAGTICTILSILGLVEWKNGSERGGWMICAAIAIAFVHWVLIRAADCAAFVSGEPLSPRNAAIKAKLRAEELEEFRRNRSR